MGRRLTQQEFESRLYKINPNIQVLGKYIGRQKHILCECKIDGYQWFPIAGNILNGTGCPKCNDDHYKAKTQEEFEQELYKINPNIQIIGKYVNCRCKIDNYEWNPKAAHLLEGHGCPKCAGEPRYTQTEFEQKVHSINSNIIILSKYVNANTRIKCKCSIDGYEWYPMPSNILRGENCPVCRNSSKSVFKGVNDMWTTNPELAKLLANPKDGYKYTQCSNQYVDWKCPNCGNIIKNKMINQIQRAGLSCRRCGDGISYPEKFMYSFLQQLHINFITQYSHTNANWCSYNNYRVMYDFYIPLLNCIIETHGLQHYKERDTSSIYHNTLRKEQENDKFKKQLAIRNGIKEENYIVIDCRCSTIEWIKNSILHSQLSKLFDLSQINWIECHKYAVNSLVKLVCEYKKGHNDLTFVQTGKHFNLGRQTIRKYLKQGEKLGWFDYNCNNKELSSTKVQCVELNKMYESISSAMKLLNISNHHIGDCCKDRNKTAGGYHWMYYEDYLNIK